MNAVSNVSGLCWLVPPV